MSVLENTEVKMKAFNQGITKEEFLTEIYKHRDADNFVKCRYWHNGKGCAVGCSLKSVADLKSIDLATDQHKLYEDHLGVPEWLARLEDTIFENLPNELSKTWPVRFSEAINEGSDLSKIKVPFIVYLMKENLKNLDSLKVDDKFIDVKNSIELSKKAVQQMIEAQELGDKEKIAAAESAAWSARSAARSAESAAWSAWSAARSAESADSARSAESAAWSARSAESAAWSARSAAESAAWSADSARSAESARSAAWSAWSAARSAESAAWSAAWSAARSAAWSAARSAAESAAFIKHSEKLLELMKECK